MFKNELKGRCGLQKRRKRCLGIEKLCLRIHVRQVVASTRKMYLGTRRTRCNVLYSMIDLPRLAIWPYRPAMATHIAVWGKGDQVNELYVVLEQKH